MRILCNGLMLLLSISAALYADKDEKFQPGPASSYPSKQTISNLTIAADVFSGAEEVKSAFGKLDPNDHGVLPVLVVMENASDQVLRLERMRVEYIRDDGRRVEAIPAGEVKYLYGVEQPNLSGQRLPYPPIPGFGKKKNPLAAFEIEGRAFSAKMLPPGDSASGFFYFHTAPLRNSTIYVTDISEAATGQDLFFFEIPLD